jgi:hypothetical protein
VPSRSKSTEKKPKSPAKISEIPHKSPRKVIGRVSDNNKSEQHIT